MLKACSVLDMVSVALMVLGAGVVSGQDYPNKPIRIFAIGPGGSSDFTARLIAPGLGGGLGQQVIVENRPSGVIPGQIVAKAPPDGYTLLVVGSSLWLAPLLREDTPYDPIRDFSPVTMITRAPNILVVHPSVPVKSVQQLIALAKARPGALNYSSANTGASSHLAAELFKHMARVNIVRVPFKSGSSRMAALISGEVQLEFATAGAVAPYIKSGRLRALAVTSAEPTVLARDLPTVAAAGLPGYESVGIWGMFLPAKTPATIINRLNQETVQVVNRVETKEKFLNAGVETVGSSPEQLAATMKSEVTRMGKVIKDAGIREE